MAEPCHVQNEVLHINKVAAFQVKGVGRYMSLHSFKLKSYYRFLYPGMSEVQGANKNPFYTDKRLRNG